MTVPVQSTYIAYTYSGSATFDFPFRILSTSDLIVSRNSLLATHGVDYSISGVGDPAGGTITWLTTIVAGDSITLRRSIKLERTTDYQTNGDFQADVVNPDFDRLWMAIQDVLYGGVERFLRAPLGETFNELASAAARAGTVQGYDTNGQPVPVAALSGSSFQFGVPFIDNFVGNGVQTVFPLSATPGLQKNLQVMQGATWQNNGDDFTWSAASPLQITFATAPPNLVKGQIYYTQALPVGTADLESTINSLDSSKVVFQPAGVGAVATTDQAKLRERVSIFDFMSPAQIADYKGRTSALDHTTAFNIAISAVMVLGASVELYLPAGILHLTSTITGSGAISFVGVGHAGQGTTGSSAANQGTLIKFNHTGFGVTWSGSGLTVSKLGWYRPQTAPGGGWTPLASNYDWNLSTTDTTFDDFLIWGSAKGIILNSGGRLRIKNPKGQCFNNAITIVSATDSCYMEGAAHFWPIWSQDSNVKAYMQANLTTLVTKRCDGFFAGQFFSIWHKRMWSAEHDSSGDSTNLKCTAMYSDAGGDGFVVETGTNGVSAQIGKFNHLGDAAAGGASVGCGIQLKGTNAQIDVDSMFVTGAYNNALRNSDGTGNSLRVQSLYMTSWNQGNGGFGGCDVGGTGNTTFIGPCASIGTAAAGSTNPFTGTSQTQGLWKRVNFSALTTSGAGLLSIPHGLGYAPQSADVFIGGSNGYKANVISIDATNINVAVYNGTGTLNSTAVSGSMNTYY